MPVYCFFLTSPVNVCYQSFDIVCVEQALYAQILHICKPHTQGEKNLLWWDLLTSIQKNFGKSKWDVLLWG